MFCLPIQISIFCINIIPFDIYSEISSFPFDKSSLQSVRNKTYLKSGLLCWKENMHATKKFNNRNKKIH